MPRDFSEDTEPERPREIDEVEEQVENEDIKKEAEEVANDASKELEDQERVERIREESVRELKEMDDEAERKEKADEIAREAAKELQGFEEDLRHRMEDAREDLHEEYINDMKSKLEDGSSKETSSDTEETEDGRESKEKSASGESYIEGNDGMVYSMETGEGTGSSSELETEESPEKVKEETREVEEEKIAEQEESVKVRNEISKPESPETEEADETSEELPEKRTESAKVDDTSIEESEIDESKKDSEEQVSVKESQGVEKSTRTETKEEYREEIDESAEPTPRPAQEQVEVDEVAELPLETPESEESHVEEVPESSLEHEPERMVSDKGEIIKDEDLESKGAEDELELSEEVEHHIDELVDELVEELIEEIETQEEEETTEPRIIVDAMTGNEHIDSSLEYRPYYQETEEESEHSEQAQVKEKVDEMFAKLSEEEREEFKKSIRSKLKDEKDLDEWIKRHQSVKASPDYKEKYAEAKKYLRGKRKGKVPRLIKELWKDEVKRVWTSIVMSKIVVSLGQKLSPKKKKKSQRRTGYHRGKNRTIKLHQPMIGKSRVASFPRFEKWLQENYPGLCERSDYPKLIEKIRKFFELRKALKGRTEIKQHELDDIAKSIGLNPGTAYDWVHRDKVPHLFKIIDSSMSKKEGLRLRKAILKRMSGISSWAELEDELKKVYPGDAYKRIPDYNEKEQRTKEFFAFLDELVKGGTKKGIARRSGISKRRVRAFSDGQVPWLVRNVLSKTGRLSAAGGNVTHNTSIYKVKLRPLKVRKQEIVSYADFEKLIQREFPWLKERSDYMRLMKTMRAFFDAKMKFGGQQHVTRKELVEFVKNHDVSVETVIPWFQGKSGPMVVDMLDRSLSVSEAKAELDKILKMLNGVVSLEEYKKRMRTCYISDLLKTLPSYKKDYTQVKEFYRFLKALEKGGLHTDIIGRGKLKMATTKRRLLYNKFPRLIGIATSIPATPPQRGRRWIPLKINTKGKLEKFIQVPLSISNVSDLLDVINRLNPLKTRRMKARTKRFGSIPSDIAFMYLLGALVSDGSFNRRNGTSTSTSISLSTKYVWSETFGEAFCYCLDMFGFKAGRIGNSTGVNQAGEEIENMNWQSSASPLMMWIRNTLLGLKMDTSKSHQSLNADWILKMPPELIIPFLQGVADGDGYATVRSITAGIGTKHNKEFLRKLLGVFGIHSADSGTGILISRRKSLQIAAHLPLFKYADGRLFRLREIIEMIASMKHSKVSEEERKRILEYYSQGIKVNQIGSLLWVDFGKNRRSSTVKKVIKDAGLLS